MGKAFLKVLVLLLLFTAGAGLGWWGFSSTGSVRDTVSPIVDTVTRQRPFVSLGFAPYWLITKEQDSYKGSISDWAYFGLALSSDGTIQKQVNAAEEEPGWTTLKRDDTKTRLTNRKSEGIKTSLVVHLADEDAVAALMSDATASAKRLSDDVVPILTEYGFDDLNLDIESFRDATDGARMAFTAFLGGTASEIRSRTKATVTVELTPTALIRSRLTDPAVLGQLADRVILMAYDYTYSGSYIAGPVAPAGGAGTDRVQDAGLSTALAVRVIPKEKLILGIPLYGYEWDTLSGKPGAPVVPGTGKTASWGRVATLLKDCAGCTTGTDPTGKSPYAVVPDAGYWRQFFYDDAASIREKVAMAHETGLAGVAFWALGYEPDGGLPAVFTK
jgi:spore germination protein YaaH